MSKLTAIENLRKTVRDAFCSESISMLVEGHAIMRAIDEVEAAISGSEKLTVKQVRKAIFNGSSYTSYDGTQYYASGISMQKITNELNALLCDRECEVIDHRYYNDYDIHKFELSCGHSYTTPDNILYSFCPVCGAKIGKAEKR